MFEMTFTVYKRYVLINQLSLHFLNVFFVFLYFKDIIATTKHNNSQTKRYAWWWDVTNRVETELYPQLVSLSNFRNNSFVHVSSVTLIY